MSDFIALNPTIFKDKDNKKWCIRYTFIQNHVTTYPKIYGKEYLISLNSIKNLKERQQKAELLLALVEKDLKNGINPKYKKVTEQRKRVQEKDEAKRFHYDDVIAYVVHRKGYDKPRPNQSTSAENLRTFWQNQFREYIERIGKLTDVRKITIDDIEAFIEEGARDKVTENGKLIKGWADSTCNNKLSWIGIIFSTLKTARLIHVNPCTGIVRKSNIRVSKEGSKLVRFQVYSREELTILWEHLEGRVFFKALGQTIYYSFIRVSELLRIKLWMLDLKNNKFILPPDISKNGRKVKITQEVRIPEKLKETLKNYLKEKFKGDLNPDYYLFPKSRNFKEGKKVNDVSGTFQEILTSLAKEHEGLFINRSLYSLKHSGNSHFIQNNLRDKNKTSLQILMFLQKQNRHSDLSMTQKYISEDLGEELDKEDTDFIYS